MGALIMPNYAPTMALPPSFGSLTRRHLFPTTILRCACRMQTKRPGLTCPN